MGNTVGDFMRDVEGDIEHSLADSCLFARALYCSIRPLDCETKGGSV